MGLGPKLACDRCGAKFFGGKKYEEGERNLCYDCLVPLSENISEKELAALGATQKGFVGLVRQMGGLSAMGGEKRTIDMLKLNARMISELPVHREDPVSYIMDSINSLQKNSRDAEGHDLLIGGPDSYIYPEKFEALAQKYDFVPHKSFSMDDEAVLDEIREFLNRNIQVVVAAYTKEKRIDLWVEPVSRAVSGKGDQGGKGCAVVLVVAAVIFVIFLLANL